MKRTLNLIAAGAALGLAAFAYAGSPPEDTGAAQPSTTEQPATSASPADTPAATEAPATDASASSSSTSNADSQTAPSASAQSNSAAGPSPSNNTRVAAVTPSGMSAQEACTGFSSTGECAAALHIAQNLNIPFADLKSKVTGGEKLTAAVKELKPDADAKAEVRKAETQAKMDTRAPQG